MPIITTSTSISDLQVILALQQANLTTNISPQEALEQGFVTVVHELALLKKMNTPYPHTIAKDGDRVVGYTLVMLREFGDVIPVLKPMVGLINERTYQGKSLKASKYLIMGQVCVAKSHRGQGLFKGMYTALAERMATDFDYIITEIALRNTRSLRAHEKVGFQTLHDYKTDTEDWRIVILPLKQT